MQFWLSSWLMLSTDRFGYFLQTLQSLLLDYLAVNSQSDPALLHARHFYVGQWFMETTKDGMKSSASDTSSANTNHERSPKKKGSKSKRKRRLSSSSEDSDSSDSSSDEESKTSELETSINNINESVQLTEKRKKFLLSRINPFPETSPGTRTQVLTTPLDSESAELITRFLASKRPFSHSFDSYLKHILKVLHICFHSSFFFATVLSNK